MFAPPIDKSYSSTTYSSPLTKTLLATLVVTALSSFAHADDIYDVGTDKLQVLVLSDGGQHKFGSITINHTPPITQHQFSILLSEKSDLTVLGDTLIESIATKYVPTGNGEGNYAIAAYNGSDINLLGNVDIFLYQRDDSGKMDTENIGANGIWLQGANAKIGSSTSRTKIWTFAAKPDTIQLKQNSTLKINSTNNQIVGNILIEKGTSLTGSFIGNGYFSGDDFSLDNQNWVGWIGDLSDGRDKYKEGNLDLTFENGAQWIYLKLPFITNITLNNNGVINLFDQDIQEFYTASDLRKYLSDDILEFTHNYVHIGTLKGTGGIFKMDLNAKDKSASDLLFIDAYAGSAEESSAKHAIDLVAHDLGLLESINPNNTLIFAVTKSKTTDEGSSLQFVDKVNERGEGLVDYELQINHSEMTADDAKRDEFSSINAMNPNDYVDGTKWFIERIVLSKSSAAFGMTGAGYASYDAAVEMDRLDRRLLETVRSADNDLWVRIHHGRSGAENQYRWDRTGVTIGFDRAFSEKSRAGAWFSYTEGDTEFLDVRGDGDMKRYELAVFDTLTYGNHYLDFVGRIGRVSSEYTVGNEAYTTDADYDQDYAALSAEYGYTLKSETGVFVEPQVQFQVAYLDSFDYRTSRDMKVEADSETSTIGRVGFRAGREFRTVDYAGELYFRGDVLHQFTDGQDAELSDGLHTFYENWGDTGTWANFGVGTVWNWKDRFQFQFDAERVAGGKTDDTWLISGRVNYLF